MSSNLGPLLVGLAAAGSLLVLIGIIRANWPLVARVGMSRGQRRSGSSESWATSHEPVGRPRAPTDTQAKRAGPAATADEGVGGPNVDQQASSAAIKESKAQELTVAPERHSEGLWRENEAEAARITDEARRQAREPLDEAELEAQTIIVAAGQQLARREDQLDEERAGPERPTRLDLASIVQEAAHKAEEALAAAWQEAAILVREAEAEAERRAAGIIEDGRRRVQELLDEAESEAKRVVVDTGHEREKLLRDLEQERSLLEETRVRLGSLAEIEEAVQEAENLLVAAEQRREDFQRESEAEAEGRAAEVTRDAHRRAKELLEEAELEAARIVAAGHQERERLSADLAHERSVLEETRNRLSGYLTDVLSEVEAAPAAGDRSTNVRDLDEALRKRASGRTAH
jgi:vacuolar-type H+-ATPase subunit H